ncbi:zinc-binding alcohol dehydrogenase family protein [Actinomadura litoris]|uniref:zinc-binding alcohol dehydrogenase family protein n=1 Tax=Actinomadura litoris TaxID=2678616 RepID=UPI001FA7C6DD|nr:zinc-binding alcohol dehydrogenase family protein [Actinomadura litoris]
MRAWAVASPAPIASGPLRRADRDVPAPGPGELLVRVLACGVCRTDLHVAEGDLPVHLPGVTPGHEIVGAVVAAGPGAAHAVGERVGVAWLRGTCGACRFCRRGAENLCPGSVYTGWDAHGGYAEFALAVDAYAYRLPEGLDDVRAAPLLCAGIIGYRALRRAAPPPGGRLGIWGFGGSAHLAAQIALAEGAEVHVFTRSAAARELARDLGASFAGDSFDTGPAPLDAAIIFAPAGALVPAALERLDRGGTLAIAGIHLSDVPALDYQRHLFQERQVRSVTSNTRADGEEFLALASRLDVAVTTHPYPLDEADRALADLAADRFTGAAVLVP